MAVVVIKYSSPIQDKAQLLDGTLYSKIMGWHHTAIVIQTHIKKADIQNAIDTHGVPDTYFLTSMPQVSPDPPRVRMYTIVTTCEKFSTVEENFSIERPLGEEAFTG